MTDTTRMFLYAMVVASCAMDLATMKRNRLWWFLEVFASALYMAFLIRVVFQVFP